MLKKSQIWIVVAVSLVHFLLVLKVVFDKLQCGIIPHCVGWVDEAAGVVLSFPLGILFWMLDLLNIPFNMIQWIGSGVFLVMLINSICAVLIFRSIIVRVMGWKRAGRRS